MDTRRQSGLWDQTADGHFERKTPTGPYHYYQPFPTSQRRLSYSERAAEAVAGSQDALKAATNSGLERSTSVKSRPNAYAPQKAVTRQSDTAFDNKDDDDDVPENLRAKAWSPEPAVRTKPPLRHSSNASEHIRRGSVPDRSPLQNLEAKFGNISKEEKRARLQEAERRASLSEKEGARNTPLRGGKGRVVSDGSRAANNGIRRDQRRSVSAGESPTLPHQVNEKFRRASDALKTEFARDRKQEESAVSPTYSDGLSPRSTQPIQRFESRPSPPDQEQVPSTTLNRAGSQKYRHRARDAGFAGAAAAVASASNQDSAAARGKAAHDRRKSQVIELQPDGNLAVSGNIWGPAPAAVPTYPRGQACGSSSDRTKGNRLQKAPPTPTQRKSSLDGSAPDNTNLARGSSDIRRSSDSTRQLLHGHRMAAENAKDDSVTSRQPDIITKEEVRTGSETAVPYQIPPQTAAARQAKEKVTFAPQVAETDGKGHHHIRDLLSGQHAQPRSYQSNVAPLEEWRSAEVAKLTARQIALDDGQTTSGADRDAAWWEKRDAGTSNKAAQHEGFYEEQATSFSPPIFLKCGPLLRFTGLKRSQRTGHGAQAWRGSVMIVTQDEKSSLDRPPVLRLFAQPMDLYQKRSPAEHDSNEHDEYDDHDAITGQMKTSRIGRPIFVRPVHSLKHGVDLSRQENNAGLFSAERPTTLAPQATTNGSQGHRIASYVSSRVRKRDGESLDAHTSVRAHRLHVEHGCTFWRFNLEIELSSKPARVAYRINNGPAIGFWVPARGETMNIMFHSCNGFSLSVDSAEFCGPDPLWRDVLNRHQSRPFHVMVGGGDQIYNDAAVRDTTRFKEWLQLKNPEHKYHADFTLEMQEELETFYFNRYAMWFSQGLFSMANAQIPMVNIYDDHDIIDGFGSYPHHFMSCPVFTGVGAIAFKYYMLFQHQSLPTETTKEEPSWLLGASPGPYINELNRSIFIWLGEKVALLALDCRTERMRDEILSQESYDIIFDRCRHELVAGDTKHLIVLLGVPIAYPRLNFLENILTSRLMDPIKAIGRTGALGGFVNKFDGGVEILDDLDDHWTAKHHKEERNWFVQELQELAAEKSVRVTILGGDVHLGAVGQFYSNKKLGIPKDKDHRYMPNVISSAIVNTPPPPMMADVLNRRNKIHHLDRETDEDMIPMFSHDVDGSNRNNTHLLPRRNFAIIQEYMPGSTPPATPNQDQADTADGQSARVDEQRYPPGSMKRTMSLGRGPSQLIRRLSSRGSKPPVSYNTNSSTRPQSFQESRPPSQSGEPQRSNSMTSASQSRRPSFSFQRRPTNLSLKEARRAAAKGGPHDDDDESNLPGHINLEHGLDITLCVEVDQHDPAGKTEPYRLLVPALWYAGTGDQNTLASPARRPSLLARLTGSRQTNKKNMGPRHDDHDPEEHSDDEPTPTKDASPNREVDRQAELEELQATAAGSGGRVNGNAGESRSAYHQRGYDLGSPPIGESMSSTKQSAREPRFSAQQSHFDDRSGDDQSMTVSEVETRDGASPPPTSRRLSSKAERFFGLGDDETALPSSEPGVSRKPSETGTKKRSIWTPWRAGSSRRG